MLSYREWTIKFAENIKGEAISAQIEYWHITMEKKKTKQVDDFDTSSFQDFEDFLAKSKMPKSRCFRPLLAKAWKTYRLEHENKEKRKNNNK